MPEEKIPSEPELSELYHVSRITTKKALDLLAENGYITRFPRKGSFITDRSEENAQKKIENTLPVKTIGVIMGNLVQTFGTQTLLAIERACSESGYHLMFACSYEDQNLEMEIIQSFSQAGVSGIIIMPVHGGVYNPLILRLSLDNIPVVFIDRDLRGLPIPYVGTDHFAAAKKLTDFLFSQGHKEVAFACTSYYETSSILERLDGFITSNIEHGRLTNNSYWLSPKTGLHIKNTSESQEEDLETIKKFIVDNPNITGFLAIEFELAILIREALRQLNRYSEDKESVVCFDSYSLDRVDCLRFTHVVQDEETIGKESVRLLLDKLAHKDTADRVIVPSKIKYA